MKILLLSVALMVTSLTAMAQVGIGTKAPKAALDVVSTTSGFMMPRMTTVERAAITVSADQTGMQVYDTTTGSVWLYDGMIWVETASLGAISTLINTDADIKIEVETTADDDTIRLSTAGVERLQIDSDGNVGIDTQTPSAKLDVNGDFSINQRYYINTGEVAVPGGSGAANSVAVPWREGVTILDRSFKYIVRLSTSNTASAASAYYIVSYGYSPDYIPSYNVRLVSHSGFGVNSTAPNLAVSGSEMVVYNGSSYDGYIVDFFCEAIKMRGFKSPHSFGADYQWQRNRDDLYYTDGNVGIGTTSPAAKLDVSGAIKIPAASDTENSSPGLVWKANDDFLYDDQYINHYGFGFHSYKDNSTGGFEGMNAYVSGYSGIDFFSAGLNRLRINNNGNVGIGTVTPAAKLEIIKGSAPLSYFKISSSDADSGDVMDVKYNKDVIIGGALRAKLLYAGVDGQGFLFNSLNNKAYINGQAILSKEGSSLWLGHGFERISLRALGLERLKLDYAGATVTGGLTVTENVGIGTTTPQAKLDITSTTSGFLKPRMTTAQRNAIVTPAEGLRVYDTTTKTDWYYNGTVWVEAASLGAVATLIDADADTKIEVETTADDDTIRFTVAGTELVQMNKDGIVVDLERSANSSGTGYYHGEHKTITRSGTDNERGTKGLKRLVKKTGDFNSLVLYGVDNEVILEGGGTTSFVTANVNRVRFLGTKTQAVDAVARGYDSDIRVDNPNFTGYAQGVHNTLDLRQGHITGGDVIFMDFDIPGHSSADLDVTGDLTYLVGGGGSDVAAMKTKLEAIGKKFRFIHNQGTTESDFAGIINYTGDVQNIIDASGDVLIPKKYLESLDYVVGTGTINYLPRFTATGTVGNSQVFDDGTNVGIGTTSPGSKLAVVGLPGYASDAVASTGGLVAGDFYQTSSHATLPDGVVMVKQ